MMPDWMMAYPWLWESWKKRPNNEKSGDAVYIRTCRKETENQKKTLLWMD